jgi:hypothetical protein
LKTNQPFIIKGAENISNQNLLNCFQQIYSLLSTTESISISIKNVFIYQYLSKILNNKSLSFICDEVEATQESNFFILSSTCFNELNEEIETKINNFEIILKDKLSIKCNIILGSLISDKIRKLIGKSNFIDFSTFEYPSIIAVFFSVFKGKVISLEHFNVQFLFETILFVEIEILKDFFPFSIENLSSFSKSIVKQILSLSFIHLTNENQIFEFILKQIKSDQT